MIRNSIGGTARNIAENLARLEVDTILITVVGDDSIGERILGHAAASGINVNDSRILDGSRTGTYMALLTEKGALEFALYDMDVLQSITPTYLRQRVGLFEQARMVVIDANLSPESIQTVTTLCAQHDVPLCADPTSTTLAEKIKPHLASFFMISPNVAETRVLCGCDFDASDRVAAGDAAYTMMANSNVGIACVTLSEFGVVYASQETRGHVPAVKTSIVDETGAGDAQTAAIIFGLLEGIPLDECVRLGVTAATLTLRTRETVRSDLTVEMLYDALII
jgi:pseudouridine kinase